MSWRLSQPARTISPLGRVHPEDQPLQPISASISFEAARNALRDYDVSPACTEYQTHDQRMPLLCAKRIGPTYGGEAAGSPVCHRLFIRIFPNVFSQTTLCALASRPQPIVGQTFYLYLFRRSSNFHKDKPCIPTSSYQ
jgi:hypothetical protein